MTETPAVAETRDHDIKLPDGRQLRVREAGDPAGDAVLVHHGTPCSGLLAGWWAHDALARGIRLIGYDRPGYGSSDRQAGRRVADVATDCAAIADALGIDQFRTWGVSGGGPHALACAALLADRVVAAATLASVAPYDADALNWLAGMGQDNLDEFGAAATGEDALRAYLTPAAAELVAAGASGLTAAFRSILPEVDVALLDASDAARLDVSKTDVPPVAEFMYDWVAEGQRGGIDGWVDDDLAFVRDWGFDLATIAVPVLVLQGRHDLMVPFSHGGWLAAHIPGATARLTEGDGHLTLMTKVGEVHDWLLRQAPREP